MDKERLKLLASKLMFTMNEKEYDTLLEEFDIILKQMDLIGNIKDIDKVEPMIFSNIQETQSLREDEVTEELDIDSILKNSTTNLYNQVKLPKVVE